MKKVSNIIKMCFGYNNALLSGSMDIIVVKQPNGKFKASPLRLRFSNYRVPKAGRKKVTVKVNQNIVDVPMFLQKDGTAFILLENKKYKKEKSLDDNANQINNNMKEKTKNKSAPRNNIINNEINKNDSIDNDNHSCDNNKNNITLTINDKQSKEKKDFINEEEKSDEEIVHNIKTIIVEKAPPPPELKLELSDCWDTISKNKYNKNFNMQGEFIKKIVSQDEFFKDPWKVINNPNLAIKYRNQILTSKVIIPMMFSQLVYGSPLPEDVIDKLTEGQDGHFFWKTKHKDAYRIDLEQLSLSSTENDSENKDYNSDGGVVSDKYNNSINEDALSDSSTASDKKIKKKFRMKKSSKIPSHILEKFELKEGTNEIQYIVDGYTINSNIYLWNYSDKIVISDFDGTVTRSDVIGQIGVYFGLDWTHKYIAKLYSHIAKNGYKMLYVTARTMYMQKSTKNSLYSINQDGYSMPEGPMLMNESGYVDAIKTEIIDKVPQEFKIECLLNLLKLFPHDVEPFYAGFGNKPSDKLAYEKIGIDPGKIYIINEKGEISKNFNTKCKTNFLLIDEQIDELFPFVYDNGYNSILYSENVANNYYLPDINKIIDEKEMEDEIKALLKG